MNEWENENNNEEQSNSEFKNSIDPNQDFKMGEELYVSEELKHSLNENTNDMEVTSPKKVKKQKTGRVKWLVLTAAIGFASFGGGSLYTSYQWMQKSDVTEDTGVLEQVKQPVEQGGSYVQTGVDTIGVNVSQVAQNAADSVVEISTEVASRDPFFGQFITQGAGSGVILTNDGYIITNNHVIDGAGKITVRLTNGSEYEATLIGTDSQTDVAVIKIDPVDEVIQPAKLGDSDSLVVGEVAVAIGNPLGELGGTVTNGIISALDREITISGQTMTLLQTNAAINPGNSGGGLFNSRSELVGLVVAKSSGSDVEGLGFAIPVNKVKEIAESLIQNGYVSGRPALGIKALVISSWQDAMRYGLDQTGIYVSELVKGGKAEESGLKVGDFIVGIEDSQIREMKDISSILSGYNVGDKVKVTVSRNGKFVNINLELSEMKPELPEELEQ